MSMNIENLTDSGYVVAIRINHNTKEFAVTRRIPELAGCKVIDNGGAKLLHWDWLRLNKPNQPELNNWTITDYRVSREIGDREKADLISKYEGRGYTRRTVKNFG